MPAPTRYRATARHQRRTEAAAPRQPRRAGRGPPVRPGTDLEPAPHRVRTRPQARRAAAPEGAPSALGTGSTAAAGLRTPAPSHSQPRKCRPRETLALSRLRIPAARSCLCLALRGPPGRRRAQRAHRPATGRAPDAPVPGRATLSLTPEPVAMLRSFDRRMTSATLGRQGTSPPPRSAHGCEPTVPAPPSASRPHINRARRSTSYARRAGTPTASMCRTSCRRRLRPSPRIPRLASGDHGAPC